MLRTTALLLLLTVAPVLGQNFSYPDFSNPINLVINGNAALVGSALRVSPTGTSLRGSAFNVLPVSVATGFATTFEFRVTSLLSGGADGFTFVIHDDPRGATALANHAGALGYAPFPTSPAGTGIAKSIVVEFDTWQGNNLGDTSANEISIHTNGTGDNSHFEAFSIGRTTPAINMSNGQVHTARILYVPGTLSVFLDNLTTPVLSVPWSFTTGGTFVDSGNPIGGLGLSLGDFAWVGFTASSGAASENHDILSWDWVSPLPGPAFAGTIGVGQGGPFDVLAVSGDAGGVLRTVEVPIGGTFSFDLLQPPTNPMPANFYFTALGGFAAPDAPFALPLGIGSYTYPIPFPGSTPVAFVLAETFGIGTGLIGATPTPWTFLLPGGLPVAVQLTLQAIMEQTPGVGRTTNAIYLDIK